MLNNSLSLEKTFKMSSQTIEIKVIDRKLKVSCPTGQETALVAAANELNTRLAKANTGNAITTAEQTLLMTALNLANDLLQTQQALEKERKDNQSKIELLQSTIEHALNSQQSKQA